MRNTVIRGAKTGDKLGSYNPATGVVVDIQGRRAEGVRSLAHAVEIMRATGWDVAPAPATDIYAVVEAARAMAHFVPDGRDEIAIMTTDEAHKVECHVSATDLEGRVRFEPVEDGKHAGKWAVTVAR
jgi:hypothetical protein